MIAVREAELGECQRAARALLVWGLVTDQRPNPRDHGNVRRFAEPLDAAFQQLAGYAVIVTRTAVRLARRRDRLHATPVLHTPSGRPFGRTRYALVALALAALERSGSQTTLTDLARRIRRSADQTEGLVFDPDQHPSRLALGHAVRALEDLGALTLTDGSREAWEQGSDDGEALYDVDRGLCRQVFPLPRGLRPEREAVFLHRDPTEVGRDTARLARRQRLARYVLERPFVYLDDLVESDRTFLQREARSLLADLEQLTGAQGERRKEGLALIDPGRQFSDRPFPRGGSAQQAALLLATRLCAPADRAHCPSPPHDTASDALASALSPRHTAPPRIGSPGPFVDDASLLTTVTELRDDLGIALKAAYREDADMMLSEALATLADYDLVRRVPGGIVLQPGLWRFREVTVQAPPELREQLGLFGAPQ